VSRAVDSNLLVYACLTGHPAAPACEQYLQTEPDWVTNEANLAEVYVVLVAVYGVPESDAATLYVDYHGVLRPVPLDAALAVAAMGLRGQHHLDLNDAVLLQTALSTGATALATDDQRLSAAAQTLGLDAESPIDNPTRMAMADWEEQNLPAKGLPRLLARMHHWLQQRDTQLAAEFRSATQALSRLP
jgi:predicted nucleic acid-binding protein